MPVKKDDTQEPDSGYFSNFVQFKSQLLEKGHNFPVGRYEVFFCLTCFNVGNEEMTAGLIAYRPTGRAVPCRAAAR